MTELTTEQFREARRQIVERLCTRGRGAMAEAVKAVESAAVNHQNPVNPFIGSNLEEARAFLGTAHWISGMERDGYDWNGGMDE